MNGSTLVLQSGNGSASGSLANNNTISGGSGPDTITVFGQDDQITGASGNDQITLFGNSDTITGGSGVDTITVFGNTDAVGDTTGAYAVSVNGNSDTVSTGSGPESAAPATRCRLARSATRLRPASRSPARR
jgi:Ca2+-binding RTX toxin-like protein